jgi:glycosyltransferase involved in cell wall biosynthesis
MRVLIVTSRFPLPAWRGNQVRTVEWLKALEGCRRAVVCPEPVDRGAVAELETMCEVAYPLRLRFLDRIPAAATALTAGLPVQEGIYRTVGALRAVRKAVQTLRPDVAVVQMVRCGWATDVIRSLSPDTAIVFDAIDAMGLHFDRSGRRAMSVLRPLYLFEAVLCRRRERQMARLADITTAVSERDLEAIEADAERGMVVPVSGRDMGAASPDPDKPTVLLSGNLGYRPTVKGARWFAREVWPRLTELVPGMRWMLVGARPTREVRRLARYPGVEIHGDVTDMAPFFGQATVAIAPMAVGSGLPMKVIEAWSAGVPVVADPWAAAGLDRDGAEAVATASSGADWVTVLARLLTDPDEANALGARGHRVWDRRFRSEAVAESVREAVGDAAASRGRSRS